MRYCLYKKYLLDESIIWNETKRQAKIFAVTRNNDFELQK